MSTTPALPEQELQGGVQINVRGIQADTCHRELLASQGRPSLVGAQPRSPRMPLCWIVAQVAVSEGPRQDTQQSVQTLSLNGRLFGKDNQGQPQIAPGAALAWKRQGEHEQRLASVIVPWNAVAPQSQRYCALAMCLPVQADPTVVATGWGEEGVWQRGVGPVARWCLSRLHSVWRRVGARRGCGNGVWDLWHDGVCLVCTLDGVGLGGGGRGGGVGWVPIYAIVFLVTELRESGQQLVGKHHRHPCHHGLASRLVPDWHEAPVRLWPRQAFANLPHDVTKDVVRAFAPLGSVHFGQILHFIQSLLCIMRQLHHLRGGEFIADEMCCQPHSQTPGRLDFGEVRALPLGQHGV